MKKWRDSTKTCLRGDMLLVMGDFNAVCRREPSAMSSAVGLYGLGETNEASDQLEDICLEHEMAPANTMFRHIQGGGIPGPLLMATSRIR